MELQPPSVLAQLPRPLQTSGGQTRFGDVYGFTGSKKRKRYEVAITIDGEAVNIYNVQSPTLVTSYPIPPQTVFSCRPCSVRSKPSSKKAIERQTYCASERPELQIKGFFEESSSLTTVAPVITTRTFSPKDSKSPIVFLDVISQDPNGESGGSGCDLLAVHRDGRIRRLVPDLTSQRWSLLPIQVSNLVLSGYQVVSAFLVDFDDAQKSLFKRRRDLVALAVGDSPQIGPGAPSILLLITCPSNSTNILLADVKIQYFSVYSSDRSEISSSGDSEKLRYLHCADFPELGFANELDRQDLQWNFHTSSACLQVSSRKGILNFDLSQYSPSLISNFWEDNGDFSSLLRVSPHTVIGGGQSIVALYDTKYRSIQRSIPVSNINASSLKPSDRSSSVIFVGYFAKLAIALAIKGNALLGFDLSTLSSSQMTGLKRQRDGLLINAINRGMKSSGGIWKIDDSKHNSHDLERLGLLNEDAVALWKNFQKDVESAITAGDAAAFDTAVIGYFKLSPKSSRGSPWINPEQLSFILSKIFSVGKSLGESEGRSIGDSSFDLLISMWPSFTCDWLLRTNQMSPRRIEQAVRRSLMPQILPPIRGGSIVRLLSEHDLTLNLLRRFLSQSSDWSTEDVTHALKIFIENARSCSAMLDEPEAMVGIKDAQNSSDSSHVGRSTELRLTGTTGLEEVFYGLNFVLTKLHHNFGSTDIVKSLRGILSNSDILSVIHHLRVSLATGGYTSRLSENPPAPITVVAAAPPMSLTTIVNLLNACVDAIGPSGWVSAIGFAGTAANEFDMIAHMKSEISAALAGVEEAAYIKGILREFLRYSNAVATSTVSKQRSAATAAAATNTGPKDVAIAVRNRHFPPHVKFQPLNGAQLFTYTPPGDEDSYGDSGGKMLPLSLKPPGVAGGPGADRKGYRGAEGLTTVDGISLKKIQLSTGKEKKRSQREINHLRRQAVGKYSFERLIV